MAEEKDNLEGLVYHVGSNPVEIKSMDDETVTIAGYGVIFGGIDLAGDTFDPDTDYRLEYVPVKAVYFDHALQREMREEIGEVKKVTKDAVGLFLEAQLRRSAKYMEAVMEMLEKGKLGWSSGSAPHLVVKEAGHIKRWPVIEWSLTPTPAEPRTLGVHFKTTDAVEPQAGSTSGDTKAEIKQGDNKMDDNKFSLADVQAAAAEAVKTAFAAKEAEAKAKAEQEAEIERRAEELAAKKVSAKRRGIGYSFHKHAEVGDDNTGVKAWEYWARTGYACPEMTGFIPGETYMASGMKTTLDETTGAQGEYLVPDDYRPKIEPLVGELSQMRRAGATVIQTGLKVLNVPTEASTADFAITAEAGAVNQDEPTFGQKAITVYNHTNLITATNEFLADEKGDFANFFVSHIAKAKAKSENTDYFNVASNGSSKPESVTYAATAATAAASASAITPAEFRRTIYSIADGYGDNAVLAMRRATLGYLFGLSGDPFSFTPTPVGGPKRIGVATSNQNIDGIPVFCTDQVAAIASSARVIVYFDPASYAIVENGQMTVARNPYLYMGTSTTAFYTNYRAGGALLQATAAYYLAMA